MIQEIKYNGFSANPSDFENAEGDLALSLGVVLEDGALKPILPPKELLKLEGSQRILYIHSVSGNKNLIIYDDSDYSLTWRDKDGSGSSGNIGTFYNVTHIDAIGNTLLVFTRNATNYVLWKNNAYEVLGDHLPDLDISFGLVGRARLYSISDESKSTFKITFDKINEGEINSDFTAANRQKITSQVMAKVNKFIKEQTVDKGRFCFPFFVRYALRLYDGTTLTAHSAPILMNPSTKNGPVVYWKRIKGKGGYTEATCDIMLMAASLDYRMSDTHDSLWLDDWKDIIKSIDVFISKPIYTYDQDGEFTSFVDTNNYDTKFIGKLYSKYYKDGQQFLPNNEKPQEDVIIGPVQADSSGLYPFTSIYSEWPYSRIYTMFFANNRRYPATTFHMPEFSDEKIQESIRNTSVFYKLCSITLEEAAASVSAKDRTEIIIEDDYLQSLTSREVMTDDYLSHDRLIADYSFVYNNRLNLAGVKRNLFNGFLPESMFAFVSSFYNWIVYDDNTLDISLPLLLQYNLAASVFIKENGKEYIVKNGSLYWQFPSYISKEINVRDPNVGDSEIRTEKIKLSWGCYLFYPNVNAQKIVIWQNEEPLYEVQLKPHDFLNGAYALLDYDIVRDKNFTGQISSGDTTVEVPNKIYTSEVDNPFYFPVTGINTVGTGTILGICSAAKALSQGQFGQFPLYAFTTEGVWALEVSSTGSYLARQPITRDVCINSDSITQIDSSVLFATDRGIMLISGSETICISDVLDTREYFSLEDLPVSDKIIELYNNRADEDERISIEDISFLPFREFLAGCRMIYDYTHQHIIIYNADVRYAYVYSLKSKAWGMAFCNISYGVNSYPEALAMTSDARLVNFSLSDAESVPALIMSRPLKINDPYVFKTVDTVIQRGFFDKDHVSQVLFGSNDFSHWHVIWSSKDKYLRGFSGTPYKMFRTMLMCRLDKNESIYGCSVQFRPRITDILR